MSALTVLVDLDGICADILTPWLAEYNHEYNDNLTIEQITCWDLHEVVDPACGVKIYDYIERPGFFRHLKPIPGARDAIETLKRDGHEVVIVTAPSKGVTCAGEKIEWVKEHLGLKRQDVICAHRKELISGDVLIDDSPKNVKKYLTENPGASALTIAYPYNEELKQTDGRVARVSRRYFLLHTAPSWHGRFGGSSGKGGREFGKTKNAYRDRSEIRTPNGLVDRSFRWVPESDLPL